MGKFIGQVGLQYLWGKIKYYFVTALGTSGNYLTWTKNGTTNNITVPFATTSSKVGSSTVGSNLRPIYLNQGTPYAISGVSEYFVTKGWQEGGYVSGGVIPTILPLILTTAGNRLALLPASQVIIEKTTDGGTTWVDAEIPDSSKQVLFLGTDSNTSIPIPLLNGVKNKQCGIRITITGMKYSVPEGTTETNKYQYWNEDYVTGVERYVSLSGMYFWVSSNTDRIRTRVKCATGKNPNTWVDADNGNDAYLAGWSGGNYIFLRDYVFGGSTNQNTNYWNYRIEFFTDGNNGGALSTSYTTSTQNIQRILGYGQNGWIMPNNLVKLNHLYTWNSAQDMIIKGLLPDVNNSRNIGNSSYKWANIYAATFHGSLDGNASTATKATQDASGNVITSTYAPKASPALTGTPTAPTAAAGTNTTQIATTAFVKTATEETITNALVPLNNKINTLEEGVLEDEEIVATSLVNLNNRLDTVLQDLEDDEQAIAGALTDLNEKIESKLDVFIVTANLNSQINNSAPVDKSVTEVLEALEAGKIVLLVMGTIVVPCIGVLNINNTTTVMYTASLGDSVIIIGLLNSTIQWETTAFNSVAFNGISKGTTTGSGNAVTDISVSNTGEITLTKGTTFLTSHLDISGKADKIIVVDASSSMPSTLDPNKVYNLGTLTGTVTIPAFSSVDANDNEAKVWCFTFSTSTTAPTITWPSGITTWNGGSAPIIGVSMKYEVSVMNGLGIVIES